MNKRMITKILGGVLGLGILAATFLKDVLDQKEQEEYINELLDEKLDERLGSDQEEESDEETYEEEEEE